MLRANPSVYTLLLRQNLQGDLDQEHIDNLLKAEAPKFLLGFASPIIANIIKVSPLLKNSDSI